MFLDARVLLLDVPEGGGEGGWDRFEHEVLEVSPLISYRFPEDNTEVFATLGGLNERLSKIHSALGEIPVYIYSDDGTVTLRVLSDYANRAKGFAETASTSAKDTARAITLTAAELRTTPDFLVVICREEDSEELLEHLLLHHEGQTTYDLVSCGRLGVLEAEVWQARELVRRNA